MRRLLRRGLQGLCEEAGGDQHSSGERGQGARGGGLLDPSRARGESGQVPPTDGRAGYPGFPSAGFFSVAGLRRL